MPRMTKSRKYSFDAPYNIFHTVHHLGMPSSSSCSGNTGGYQSQETWARIGLTASLAFPRLPVGVFGGSVGIASCCCCSCGRMLGSGVGLWGDGVLGIRLGVLEK